METRYLSLEKEEEGEEEEEGGYIWLPTSLKSKRSFATTRYVFGSREALNDLYPRYDDNAFFKIFKIFSHSNSTLAYMYLEEKD